MDPPTFLFTEEELNNAGFLGDGVSKLAAQVLKTMQDHPELLKLTPLTLQCIDEIGRQLQHSGSPIPPASSGSSIHTTMSSSFSALSVASDATHFSPYAPDEYERTTYYNGITGNNNDHPELVYRSDFLTTPFPKPEGRFAYIPVKSVHGVFDTPLSKVWDTVGPQIKDLIKGKKIRWSSIDPARFFTHPPPEALDEKGTLGPVVIWVGVIPGSTSADMAHEVSQEILVLLAKNGVNDTVLEWREAVLGRLAGRPLLPHVGSHDPTHYVRRFLTALLGIPLATEGMELEDSQGTLTLWFHENKDKDGKPSNKVYGVSNCHVLRKDTTVEYEYKGSARKDHVRVCSMRRFQWGLDEIRKAIGDQGILGDIYATEVIDLRAKERPDQKAIRANQRKLDDVNEAIADLEALYEEVTRYWPDINLHRNIGHVEYAAPITVDVEGGTLFTSDWAAFLAAEPKVKQEFEGNIVDLASKYSPEKLTALFYPLGGSSTTFKFPVERKLRIEGCVMKEELANPEEFNADGKCCYIVGKVGSTTNLTVGCYAGLVSFTVNEVGTDSIELGIYNSGLKNVEAFSAKGDSGSLVWHSKDDKGHIVGQLHSGSNKGGMTSNHVSYLTPGWYLLDQIRKKFKDADFYHHTW